MYAQKSANMSITLAPYNRDSLELLYAWRKDPVVRQFNPVEDLSLESLHDRYAAASNGFADFNTASLFFWLIRAGDKVVGNISIKDINKRMLTAEIGYGISSEERGNGYATEAVRLVTQSAVNESPLRKLIAYVHEDNLASRRVLEKVRYRPEGVLREHYLINGMPANEIIYGILRREFNAASKVRTD
jgi:RimJ/RimL family protein N-acetyltransferase